MKTLVTALAGLVAGTAIASIPNVPQYRFSFLVQNEDAPLAKIDAAVPLGTVQRFQATEHLRIEVQVPASTGEGSHTIVRLIDDTRGVLHRADTTGPMSMPRQVAYLVCDGRTTYFSPAPADAPRCEK